MVLHSWTQPFSQWTSAYFYGTDILLGLLFIFWLARTKKWILPKPYFFSDWRNPSLWLAVFFVISAISVFNSHLFGLSLYQLVKLAEFIGFYFYIKNGAGKVFDFKDVLLIVVASGFFQSIIAIAQYLKQGSLGLRLLGESPLSVDTSGVAVFIADSHKYIRAYGTTPHPNVLAAWLFVAIFSFYLYYIYDFKSDINSRAIIKIFGMLISYAVILFAFFFTFSRVIIGLWAFGATASILIVFFKKDLKKMGQQVKPRIIILTIASLIAVVIFSLLFWPQVKSRIHVSAQEDAVTQRVFYNKIAGSAAIAHPLIGVGIGQFVPDFMSKLKHLPLIAYQPAHNIYLLIASETGFIGLGAYLMFLFFIFYGFILRTNLKKPYHSLFFILAASFLLFGLFDHFLWTLQQGGLIFWMVMALLSVDSG